ncbi:hypothetical protein [Novipirellula artificiosorum]|uniref:Uncharacterized protein n=1 Tax=Novipirellula artificiosorum TaxID=2528016 RepID=A0A5C6E0L6_9BACT|nr:hypothetical protein [Novipirellula artificiosorum]TWU42400.1 hypothetical protein Poly41_06970 [Novipirellula artificiosorum]
MRNYLLTALTITLFSITCYDSSQAAEPGWSPVVVATGSYRQQIQSTPIEYRPYRPLHFYGNAVRRRYYRGTVMPRPAEFATPITILPNAMGARAVGTNGAWRGY